MLSTLKTIKLKALVIAISLSLASSVSSAAVSNKIANNVELTVEELRIDKAIKSVPEVALRLSERVDEFTQQVNKANN